MDGVIVDTAKYHFLAWQRLADSLSIEFTEHHNEQLKGVSRVDSLERILHWGNLVIVDGTIIHMSKPHPEVFMRGAAALGLQPIQCVVFEDAISGVQAAIDGGFPCIGIGDAHILNQATVVVPDLKGMNFERIQNLLG